MAKDDLLGTILPYVVIGGIAIYALNKFSKPIEETLGGVAEASQGLGSGISTGAGGLGTGIKEIGEGIGSPFAFVDTIFDTLSNKIKNNQNTTLEYPKGQTTQELINAGQTIFGLTGEQIVQNKVSQASKNKSSGKSSATTPLYDKKSGTGVNAAGFGYSSAFDLGSKGTGTGVSNATFSKTGTVNNPFKSGIFKK